jgi:oxygen-independent coproporphyrinogen-3 oxidase
MSTIKSSTPSPRYAEPRSAYVHVPFCRHRCGYCNFTLVAGRDDLIARFLSAIGIELAQLGHERAIDTLYFGGGTPTHLPPSSLSQLIAITRKWFLLAPNFEFTVEANPLDLTTERIGALQAGGVTRLSLGVQSFDDRWLKFLERDHRFSDLMDVLKRTAEAFSNISMDLIFGLPDQTEEEWKTDLRQALEFRPQHLSVYGLTFERGTSFWSRLQRGELARCNEERERNMYEQAIDMLTAAGFEHYEVSNFAQPGFRCHHNEAYWLGRTYFAAGPGAARHIDGRREINHRSTTTYLTRVLAGQSPVAESETLSAEEAARERFVFGLRRLQGIDVTEFAEETGFPVERLFGEPLSRFHEAGLIEQQGAIVRLTRAGLMISDAMWPDLLAPANSL